MEKRGKLFWLDFLLENKFKSNFTFIMLALAFVCLATYPSNARTLCFYAATASVFGDLFLMNYQGIPALICKNKNFYVGAFFFAIAHVFYYFTFLNVVGHNYFIEPNWGGYSILIAFVIVIPTLIFVLANQKTIFKILVISYTCCIFSSMLSIFNCAYDLGGRYIFACIGIVLFLVSDILILVREKFLDTKLIRKFIWILYPIGQILIIINV